MRPCKRLLVPGPDLLSAARPIRGTVVRDTPRRRPGGLSCDFFRKERRMMSPQASLRFSVLGLGAAAAVHAATFVDLVPGWVGAALFLGIFPVLFFSVSAFGREARKRQAQEGGTGLSILLREAPTWLMIGAGV